MNAEKLDAIREALFKISETHGSGNIEMDLIVSGVAVTASLIFLYFVALARDKASIQEEAPQHYDSDHSSVITNDLRAEMRRMQVTVDHEVQSLRNEVNELRQQLHYISQARSTQPRPSEGRSRRDSTSHKVDLELVSDIRDVFDRRSTF